MKGNQRRDLTQKAPLCDMLADP